MVSIAQAAKYVRSKNAGPFWITTDIFFGTEEDYKLAKESKNLNTVTIANAYGVDAAQAKLFYLDDLRVIKISVPRACPQGGIYEQDMHSGQQYVQILDIVL